MDKTGTITEGKPVVTDIFAVDGDENALLKLAAAVEKPSEHPLASAILDEAAKRNISFNDIENFTAVSGRGIVANINSEKVFAGEVV